MNNFISLIYLLTAALLIYGLREMASPKTARRGIVLAGIGMLVAVLITFLLPSIQGLTNYILMIIAMTIGSAIAWYSGKKVMMIHMPQMIALFNGMGGGAAGAVAALEFIYVGNSSWVIHVLAVLGGIIGTLSFSGSIMAFAKLQELIQRPVILPKHQWINAIILLAIVALGASIVLAPQHLMLLIPFYLLLLLLGVTFTLPIGGANMPVVISLFNAMTGIAVSFNGFTLDNPALVIAGTVVGASGILLTQLMARAMHKSVFSILFSSLTPTQTTEQETTGSLKPIEIEDAAVMMAYAKKVIIVPGYGMAVAQAQHKINELRQRLEERGITVKFAIHPVAGRMPGHMNVLLAEAGVPYDEILDLDEVNPEFANTDVALVIGANDVVNPAARTQPSSPIYGMPILNVAAAHNVLVVKRGQGKGFSGVENELFTLDNVNMLYGDGQDVINKLVQAIKAF
ncbi:MAG: NAD(P)(+) transhydrogenase (Re/Si-specific) subunit beta [Gammaproteobacteria bacterium]